MTLSGFRLISDEPHGAPGTTSLTNASVRYRRSADHHVALARGDVTAIIVDNSPVDSAELPGHRAGYNGIASLKHKRQPSNLFVPRYAGLNFEHIHDGTSAVARDFFEPRSSAMEIRIVDGDVVELYQPPTPNWKLESCGRFHSLEDGTIEYTFECIAHEPLFRRGFMGFFWASYIHNPQDAAIHFRGSRSTAGRSARWIRSISPRHGSNSTHAPNEQIEKLSFDPSFPLTLIDHPSDYRYDDPWYFGVSHGMAYVQMFRSQDRIWFAQSPTGGGASNPAWDFQWFVPRYRVGRAYGFVMRASYLPFDNYHQIETATAKHRAALKS